MARSSICILLFLLLIIPSLQSTNPIDVLVLEGLFKALSCPTQLTGWVLGGDPCLQLWRGVVCNGSSVISIKLDGLGLGGFLINNLNLPNLTHLNLSSNNIQGHFPSVLPLSLTVMDLSYNKLTGELPSSIGKLENLHELYLQNNKFTGSVNILANLSLLHLNIQKNSFSGVVPKEILNVQHLWIEGNLFKIGADYLPRNFSGPNIKSSSESSVHAPIAFGFAALLVLLLVCFGITAGSHSWFLHEFPGRVQTEEAKDYYHAAKLRIHQNCFKALIILELVSLLLDAMTFWNDLHEYKALAYFLRHASVATAASVACSSWFLLLEFPGSRLLKVFDAVIVLIHCSDTIFAAVWSHHGMSLPIWVDPTSSCVLFGACAFHFYHVFHLYEIENSPEIKKGPPIDKKLCTCLSFLASSGSACQFQPVHFRRKQD